MRLTVLLALLALTLPAIAQETTHSRPASDALVAGVAAFKAGHYDEATRDFQAAVDAEPTWHTARLYLGTALSYQVIPNLDTPENIAVANRALDQFNQLLASEPQDLNVLRQIAAIQRNIKRLDEAVDTERKILALDPTDAEAHYTIGAIDWTRAYKFTVATLANDSLADDGVGNTRMSAATCSALISQNTPVVEDGIAELTRAVELRPGYDDAMQYLNLTYRLRASLDCRDPAQRKQDLATAGDWVRRATDARRANEAQREQQVSTPRSSLKASGRP